MDDDRFEPMTRLSLGDVDPSDAVRRRACADPRSFAEVVALAGERRDCKLKVHLEEHVSLVKFDAPPARSISSCLPGAPPQIANELREKLNAWTQRALGRACCRRRRASGRIGEVRREREAAELEALEGAPGREGRARRVPDAKIAEIRTLIEPRQGRDRHRLKRLTTAAKG